MTSRDKLCDGRSARGWLDAVEGKRAQPG